MGGLPFAWPWEKKGNARSCSLTKDTPGEFPPGWLVFLDPEPQGTGFAGCLGKDSSEGEKQNKEPHTFHLLKVLEKREDVAIPNSLVA